jgi:hypothetical protein
VHPVLFRFHVSSSSGKPLFELCGKIASDPRKAISEADVMWGKGTAERLGLV